MELVNKIGNAKSLLTEFDKDTSSTKDETANTPKMKLKRDPKTRYNIYEDGKVVATTESSSAERTRRFFIRTYIDVKIIDKYLKTAPWVQYWGYCYHDKDVYGSDSDKCGQPKTPHTHITLYTFSGKTSSAVQKIFDRLDAQTRKEGALPEKTEVEIMRDTCIAWRYLRHLDDPDKYQYPENERIANDKQWWFTYERTDGLNDSANNTGYQMFMERLNGATVQEMALKYGKEWLYHQKHIDDNIRLHLAETCDNKALPFDENLLSLILKSSNFSLKDIAIFKTILGYVQRTCKEEYGSPIDFYFREDKEKNA